MNIFQRFFHSRRREWQAEDNDPFDVPIKDDFSDFYEEVNRPLGPEFLPEMVAAYAGRTEFTTEIEIDAMTPMEKWAASFLIEQPVAEIVYKNFEGKITPRTIWVELVYQRIDEFGNRRTYTDAVDSVTLELRTFRLDSILELNVVKDPAPKPEPIRRNNKFTTYTVEPVYNDVW